MAHATFIVPRTEAEWEPWRGVFTKMYKEDNVPLPKVMKIMEEQHHVKASVKMYKNKIKDWRLSKYLKAEEAQQILEGKKSGSDSSPVRTIQGDDEAVKRAERSVKRKRARERAHTQSSTVGPELHDEPESYEDAVPPSAITNTVIPWNPPATPIPGPQLSGAAEQFLFNLRAWTHDAFLSGQWDTKLSAKHHSGRQASRRLSSDLTAGTNLYKKGKEKLAWTYWKRAVANFENPDLFKTWYYETPLRLLFEMGRLAHQGHSELAAMLLRYIKQWANQYLEESDSRRALFSVFGDLDVSQLRELYDRAAKSLFNGLESRIESNNPLLYEIRLNRALDMLWYDPDADVTEWVPPIAEVDEACGPKNPYSVYFLLLEAYRLVAQESYPEADDVCTQARTRLAAMSEGSIDPWRVGLAYRRLGRQQQGKGRFPDARRSFNTALRYVGTGNKLSTSILIEICQYQESMANEVNDPEDAALWSHMLKTLEQQAADQEEAEIQRGGTKMLEAAEKLAVNGDGSGGGVPDGKRRRRGSLGVSPSRSNTL